MLRCICVWKQVIAFICKLHNSRVFGMSLISHTTNSRAARCETRMTDVAKSTQNKLEITLQMYTSIKVPHPHNSYPDPDRAIPASPPLSASLAASTSSWSGCLHRNLRLGPCRASQSYATPMRQAVLVSASFTDIR